MFSFKSEKGGGMTAAAVKDSSSNTLSHDLSGEENSSLVLTFQTLEYRMKKVREQAIERKKISSSLTLKSNPMKDLSERNTEDRPGVASLTKPDSIGQEEEKQNEEIYINASVKVLNQTMFIFVHDKKYSLAYRVDNRSITYVKYFRQRGCEAHPWNSLSPGDSVNYTWEEPIKPNMLLVRVGNQNNSELSVKHNDRVKTFPFKIIKNEDQGALGRTQEVNLDEIGHKEK